MTGRLHNDLIVRTVLIWVGLRVFLAFAAALPETSVLGVPIGIGVTTLVGLGALADVRVCHESLLVANLGTSRAQIFAVGAAVGAALETAVQTSFVLLWRVLGA